MNKIKIISLLLVITVVASTVIYAGGGNRNGTAGAAQLLVPVGARGIAMGGSTLTGAKGVEGLYWNPANLARSDYNTTVMFSQMNYIADIGVSYAAIGTNIEGFGALGFSLKAFSMDEIAITTVEKPDGNGQYFTPQFVTLGLTYSRLLSDRIAVGVTMNYVTEKLDLVSASGIAFNIGVSYKNLGNVDGLSFAVAIKNLGPQMKYDGSALYLRATSPDLERPSQLYKIDAASFELPSTLELGLGYELSINESNNLSLNGIFQNSNFYGDEYKLGGEYAYDNTFFVRAGYAFIDGVDEDANIYGLTAGAGINYSLGSGMAVKFDYAYRDTEFFDSNHVFTLQFGF
ncbi:MAG: PorV/PorQ family protein [Bacteroidota bacterium]